jgi:hypothetical protein
MLGGARARWSLVCCVLTSAVFTSASVVAEPNGNSSSSTSSKDKKKTKELLKKGADAFDKGNFEQALAFFYEAQSYSKNPRIYYNIGKSLIELKREEEGAEALEDFLSRTSTDVDPKIREPKDDASTVIFNLRKKLAWVDVITRTVDGTEITADVTIDGRTTRAGRVYLPPDPGEHTFKATAKGMQPNTNTISVAGPGQVPVSGTDKAVKLLLRPEGSTPEIVTTATPSNPPTTSNPPRSDVTTIKSKPDQLVTATTGSTGTEANGTNGSTGTKTLVASNDPNTVPTTTGGLNQKPPVGPSAEPNRVPAYIAWGAAVLAAVPGAIFGVQALNESKKFSVGKDGDCKTASDPAACQTWQKHANLANGFWIGAGAATGVGVVLFIVAPGSGSGGSGGEVGVQGHF